MGVNICKFKKKAYTFILNFQKPIAFVLITKMFKIRYIVLSFLFVGGLLYYAANKCVDCVTCNWCNYIAPITRLFDDKTERLTDYEIEGVDISKYQRAIGWDVVSKQGIDFAFVKATEGANLTDSHFGQNWTTIKQVGMKRGAYHFFSTYGFCFGASQKLPR